MQLRQKFQLFVTLCFLSLMWLISILHNSETFLNKSGDSYLKYNSDVKIQYSVSNVINSKNIRRRQAVRRLPSVIIIGVKKCGTRALLEYLKLHPFIKAPGPEPHFFDRNYHLGLDWYRSKMPPTYEDEITVEKTPRYFVTPGVPERIFNMSNATKLLLVIRDPVIRAISDFTQSVSKGGNSTGVSFTSRVLRRNGKINAHSSIVDTGIYVKYMQKWLHIFGKKNIHLVSGENLINNPIEELEKVQDFIGVERKIHRSAVYFNTTRGFPCIYRREKIHLISVLDKRRDVVIYT